MRFHYQVSRIGWVLGAAMMMPSFLRRTSAFVYRSSSTPRQSFSRTPASMHTAASRLQLLRGGGDSSPVAGTYATTRRTLSSLPLPATIEKQAGISIDKDDIDREAKNSLFIVGTSVSNACLHGIPYLDTSQCNEFRVLFVLGGPGAGKGTQSDLLKANYPCVHLSAGELLRAETTKEDSPHRELIETCLVSGNIVPVEISLSLLETAMREAAQQHGNSLIFLIDGFPRNFDNLDGWIRCMKGIASVWGVLNYQCPLEVLEERILKRAKDSGRSDDNLQSARKRFATFERDTMPVVETLRQVEKKLESDQLPSPRVFDISGDQTVEKVWLDTQRAMDRMISYDVLTAHAQLLQAIDTKNATLYRQVCADEWFDEEDKSMEEIMKLQEGDAGLGKLSNVKLTYISGTKVSIEYDRMMKSEDDGTDFKVQETRIWSHQGIQGWKNIHFARLPAQ